MAGLLLAFTSCKKDSKDISYSDRPVIEAYLTPGTPVLVKVNMQKGLLDTASYGFPISDLKISLSDGINTVSLKENKPGNYIWDDPLFVTDGKTYKLSFTYLDELVSAQTIVPDKPLSLEVSNTALVIPIFVFGSTSQTAAIPVQLSWNNNNNQYHLLVFKNQDAYPSKVSRGGFGNLDDTYHDTEQSVGQVSTYQIQPMAFRYTGHYKVFLYTINKEYSDVLNTNGGSSLNLTNPVTNIVNGLGIFTAMQADSVNLNVYEQ
ncbi:MAG: hypothetical protein JWN56_2461 [Sphingobacteriales bacterium]|nr:hypothetical protein [Sphingobacteriales bacterium]